MGADFISIVIPVYNEEEYVEACIESILLQDYPENLVELIFVDGCSSDKTREIIEKFVNKHPLLIRIYDNPDKTVPYAMNIGINHSKGKYIIRLDAHAEYPKDYFSRCVFYLNTINADNVGGVVETKGKGFVGKAIAKILSSKFGVGNSQFRTDGKSGYVDTVPFGAFKREVFDKWGGFDERLTRNQDNEMNYRIRKNGGKIFLADDIRLSYYSRDSIGGLCDMAVKNGMWNIITMKLCPGAMSARHFIPLAFTASLIFLLVAHLFYAPFLSLLAAESALYLFLDFLFSLKLAGGGKEFLLLLLLFPVFHFTYGFGSLKGIVVLIGTSEYRAGSGGEDRNRQDKDRPHQCRSEDCGDN